MRGYMDIISRETDTTIYKNIENQAHMVTMRITSFARFTVRRQSTGHEDPYGKDIYENDIVIPAGLSTLLIVKYREEYGAFCLIPSDKIDCDINIKEIYMFEPGKDFYVVGNIIDNIDDIDDNKTED